MQKLPQFCNNLCMSEAEKAAAAVARDKALTVACPVCSAAAGERCLNTVTGQPGNFVHGGRVSRWQNGAAQ